MKLKGQYNMKKIRSWCDNKEVKQISLWQDQSRKREKSQMNKINNEKSSSNES